MSAIGKGKYLNILHAIWNKNRADILASLKCAFTNFCCSVCDDDINQFHCCWLVLVFFITKYTHNSYLKILLRINLVLSKKLNGETILVIHCDIEEDQ